MKLLGDMPYQNHTYKLNQEKAKLNEKQGITTILNSDHERTKSPSLRRTLSADMLSKKWLNQNGFSPNKKALSSPECQKPPSPSLSSSFSSFASFFSFEEEKQQDENKALHGTLQFDIWNSIQEENRKKENEKPTGFESWISILSQKSNDDKNALPPPYVHPLVKRSTSSLSEKSLQICTESLGSETGSDGFSSYPPSQAGDAQDEDETEREQSGPVFVTKFDENYNYTANSKKKLSPAKSFPPPLPCLSSTNGASLRMQSSRKDGRLVLEAISIPSEKNFKAQRENGRLVLTFADKLDRNENESKDNEMDIEEKVEDAEEFDEGMVNFGENNDGDEEKRNDETGEETEEEEEEAEAEAEEVVVETVDGGEGMGIIMEKTRRGWNKGVSVHKLAMVMNKPKPMVLANPNPPWPSKFSEVVIFEEENQPMSLPQSLGGVARVITKPPSTTTFFNAYEYFWRTKSTATTLISHPSTQQSITLKNYNNEFVISKNAMPNDQEELLLFRGNKADFLLPLGKSCKETRKSLLFWEPPCIATS